MRGGLAVVKRNLVVAALVTVLLVPITGWAQSPVVLPPIMPLAEVKPGMRGIGRTVIEGQKIEEFTIEVIGILSGAGGGIPVKHLILFRLSGPVTDRSGGTAAGMSGSPLFINGKLIGALSAGYLFQPGKRELALATPIEEMLTVLDLPAGSPGRLWPRTFVATRPISIGERRIDKVVIARDAAQAKQMAGAGIPGLTAFVPAAFPVSVRGLSPRAERILAQVLGLERPFLQYLGGPTAFAAAPITGGSSVGILQVRGDVTFGGICTVTLRVGDKLLICGHPWDQLGDVEYALTSSDIVTVVRTLERPFKEGNLGDVIGKIDQDRGPGIRGVVGQFPRMFAVRVVVTNTDVRTTISKGLQVVRRRDLAKVFATTMALAAIERARDQVVGGGTAKVQITLRGKGLPRPIVRENLFYSSRDIASAAVQDFPDTLNFLFNNDLVALDPVDASVEITFSSKRTTAAITDAKVERREVSPGDLLRVRLTLRPYQGESQTRMIDVQVPKNFPLGPAVLAVGSAGVQSPGEGSLEARLAREPDPIRSATLDEALEGLENAGKNTDILLQLVPFGLPTEAREFLKFDVPATRLVDTNWVIQGSVQVPILVR